jgi:hypothetical protein
MTCTDSLHRELHEQTDLHMEAIAKVLQRPFVAEHLVKTTRIDDLKGLVQFGSKLIKANSFWQRAIKDANKEGVGDDVPSDFTVARDLNVMDVNRLLGNSSSRRSLLSFARTLKTKATEAIDTMYWYNNGQMLDLPKQRCRLACASCKRPDARYRCPCIIVKHLRTAYCDHYCQDKDWDVHKMECRKRRRERCEAYQWVVMSMYIRHPPCILFSCT